MKVKKSFSISKSAKFPRGAFSSYTFGTEIEADDISPDELQKMVVDQTIQNMKEYSKKDKKFKYVLKIEKENADHYAKLAKAEKELEDA